MQFISWNVQGAFPQYTPIDRIENQIRYIEEDLDCPDVIALNEVNRHRRDTWLSGLSEIGYQEIVHTLDWATELGESDVPPHQDITHGNGNLTAIHEDASAQGLERVHPSIREGPWEDADRVDWETNFPEKILHTEFDDDGTVIDLWNVRAVPGSGWGVEKIKILENVYDRIVTGGQSYRILAGDFNAPQSEAADGTIVPWRHDQVGDLADRWASAEMDVLRGLEDEGMVDVFRELHGYGSLDVLDVSHATGTDDPSSVPADAAEGKRFDHIIASRALQPARCFSDQEGFRYSDHAPLVASFDV